MSYRKVVPYPALIVQEELVDIHWALQPVLKWARIAGISLASPGDAARTRRCTASCFSKSFVLIAINIIANTHSLVNIRDVFGKTGSVTNDWTNMIASLNFGFSSMLMQIGLLTVASARWPDLIQALRNVERRYHISHVAIKQTRKIALVLSAYVFLVF